MSVLVKNESGEEIPAWGIMLVTGTERLTNNRIALTVDQIAIPPTTAGRQYLLINGATPIGLTGDARYGHGTDPRVSEWIGYDTADGTPAFGSMWGVEDGEWLLKKDAPGFSIVGLPDTAKGRVTASFLESPQYYFTLTANLSAPSSLTGTPTTAQALLYTRYAGGTSLSGQVGTITNRWKNLELDSGKGGWCVWDWTLLEWVIVSTECPED